MDDTPEATAIQTPPPAEIVEAPAAPEVSAETTAPEVPAPEAPEVPGPSAAPEETPEETPLNPRDELEHKRFKPHLERRDRRTAERVRAEEAQNRQQAQASADAESVNLAIQNAYGNIAQKLEGEGVETLDRYLPRLEAVTAPWVEKEKTKLRDEGATKGAGQAAQQLYGAVLGSLDSRGQEDLQDYVVQNHGASWADILNQRDEIRENKTKKSSSDEITSLKAQIEGLKAKARPDGPDTTPKGGSDGRSDEEIQLDPNTSIEKLIEIEARQAAG